MQLRDSLETLMVRYQAGDFAAARELIHQVSPQLYRFLATQSAIVADADDLLQDTWLRVHRVRHTYRPGEPVLPWFYAIARRVRIDHYRGATRTNRREQRFAELPESAMTPVGLQKENLEELLAPLTESQREVVELLKVAGLSLEEVARATSSTVGAVKQKAHRAYEKLRKAWRPTNADGKQDGVSP